MKCPKCQQKVNDNVERCAACGFRLEDLGERISGLPRRSGWLIDRADVIDEASANDIYGQLIRFNRRTGIEFYVMTVPTSGNASPTEYAFYFLNHYDIGGSKHRGLVLALFQTEKALVCEVGYSLEHIITDEAANDILKRDAVPAAGRGEYGEALYTAVQLFCDILVNGRSRVRRFLSRTAAAFGKGGRP